MSDLDPARISLQPATAMTRAVPARPKTLRTSLLALALRMLQPEPRRTPR